MARAFSQRRRTSVSSRVSSTWAASRPCGSRPPPRRASEPTGRPRRRPASPAGQRAAAAGRRRRRPSATAPEETTSTCWPRAAQPGDVGGEGRSQARRPRRRAPDQQRRADLDDDPRRAGEAAHGASPSSAPASASAASSRRVDRRSAPGRRPRAAARLDALAGDAGDRSGPRPLAAPCSSLALASRLSASARRSC